MTGAWVGPVPAVDLSRIWLALIEWLGRQIARAGARAPSMRGLAVSGAQEC